MHSAHVDHLGMRNQQNPLLCSMRVTEHSTYPFEFTFAKNLRYYCTTYSLYRSTTELGKVAHKEIMTQKNVPPCKLNSKTCGYFVGIYNGKGSTAEFVRQVQFWCPKSRKTFENYTKRLMHSRYIQSVPRKSVKHPRMLTDYW